MSKKIDEALNKLIKALEKHADAVGDSHVSLKKSDRAAVRLQAAAGAYAQAVYVKSGLETPFNEVVRSGLDSATLDSLAAERDALSKKKSK